MTDRLDRHEDAAPLLSATPPRPDPPLPPSPPPAAPLPDELHVPYVRALRIGVRVTLVLLIAAFVLYAFGLLAPAVPLGELPGYWSHPVDRFVAETHLPTGWDWTDRLHQGDVLSIIPAVFLSAMTGLCLLAVLPLLVRRRDWAFVVLIVLQLLVFALAAWPKVFFG